MPAGMVGTNHALFSPLNKFATLRFSGLLYFLA
jgi:hypothetical protein